VGRGGGTGQPYWFMCSVRRREREWPGDYPDGHEVVRTGRVRGNPRDGGYSRTLHGGSVEYRCSCGHVGWSKHVGVLRTPIGCPDGGKCHHRCDENGTGCFRVECCVPLTGVFPNDEWPKVYR
jgi:hypothetical protein